LFKDTDNPLHYAIVLMYMTLVMILAQSYLTSDNIGALVFNLLIRSLELTAFTLQVNREPPMHFDPVRLVILRSLPKSMAPWFIVTEVMPISLSLYFANNDDGGPFMPLLYLSIFLVMLQRTFCAHKVDIAQANSTEPPVQVFDDGLMKERYELIALIFIGEIAFAACGPSEKWRSTACCIFVMMTAFGCYLLCFTARPSHGCEEFW
jgi:hypothetical protein